MLLVALSANIIIIPIMLYHFNTLSLTFLLSNLLASPLLGAIIILGFLCIIISFIFLPLAKILSLPLKIILQIFLKIAEIVGNLPFSQIYLPTPKITLIVIYYLIILILISCKRIKQKKQKRRIEKIILEKLKKTNLKKIISSILIISIIFISYKQIPQKLKIYFIDVGQGDSTLIITPKGKKILIDGGGLKDRQAYDIGKNTLMPYLLDRGITKLDYIMVSHFDSDHVRGTTNCYGKVKSR